MTWIDRHVLVTGAGGFIGSHLTERLVREGARTRALVRYRSSGEWGWLDSSPLRGDIEVVPGDIRDRDSVRGAMEGVSVVFHLAALVAIPYSYRAPGSYVDANIIGTLNVLQAGRDLRTPLIVHTSTSEVYGTAQYVPIDERHPLKGQSPYSATKIGADKLAESFHLSFDLPVVTVRPFNTFGPRQSARAVIPTIISQLLAGVPVRLGSLTPTRDFNYVDNTVDGYLMAAASAAAPGQTFNIGSGGEISIGDLAGRIGQLLGTTPVIESDTARVRPCGSEVDRLCADAARARTTLGWTPRVGLDEGLRRTIEWVRANRDRYRVDRYAV